MADLGNKMNPFLAGLTGLGEGLFQGYLTRKKMDEEQRQFNEKLAMEQRQNSLMNMFRQKDDERMQQQLEQNKKINFKTITKGDFYNSNFDIAPGEYAISELNNLVNNASSLLKAGVPKQPEYTTTTVPDSKTGVETTYSHIKDTEFGSPSWKPIGDKPIYKPESTKGENKDFVEPSLVGDIEGTFATLKGMGGDANDPQKAPLKANLIAKTESLMESAGLTSDAGHIWDAVQKGADVEKAINISQLARKKSYTPKQKEYLRLYFKTRFIPQEKK